MGLFSGIKDNYKKSEAAVIVQNLLEHQASAGYFDVDPARFATNLVERVWQLKPDLFGGKFGQRPHKISVAAATLAHAANLMEENDPSRSGVLLSLGNILSEIETNGAFYPFNGIDERLLGSAVKVFAEVAESGPGLPGKIDELLGEGTPDPSRDDGNRSRKDAAAEFLDAQIAEGAMTQDQFDAVCGMLTTSSMMTGNLQEAYEIIQSKPVPTEEFEIWLDEDPEGKQWNAMWILIRSGQHDTEYRSVN